MFRGNGMGSLAALGLWLESSKSWAPGHQDSGGRGFQGWGRLWLCELGAATPPQAQHQPCTQLCCLLRPRGRPLCGRSEEGLRVQAWGTGKGTTHQAGPFIPSTSSPVSHRLFVTFTNLIWQQGTNSGLD